MNTKIFCDIAEINQIKKFNKKKIVKGFTTNPSLMRKAGAKDYKSYAKFSDLLKTAPPNFWLSPEKYGIIRDDAMTYLKERFMYGKPKITKHIKKKES